MLQRFLRWSLDYCEKAAKYLRARPVFLGFLMMTLIMVVGFLFLSKAIPPNIPFGYDQAIYEPVEDELCVGGVLAVDISGNTSGAISTSDVYRSVRGDGYFYTGDPVYVAGNYKESGSVKFMRRNFFQLPDDIPAGEYVYTHNVIQNNTTTPVGFEVYFSVVECPTGLK